MNSHHSIPQRVWFDTSIGTSPDDATALLFACKHPGIDLVGVSISGKNQQRRADEAFTVLEYADCADVPVFLGEKVARADIENAAPQHTITLGPLSNIARLILDETDLGRLHIRAGCFREVDYRGLTITAEENAAADLDATRVALSQYDDSCISAFDATSSLVLDDETKAKIEMKYPFLKSRFDGFTDYLVGKYGSVHSELLMNALLPVCDILNTATITREVIEFFIQPDGSFRRAYTLAHRPPSIDEVNNPDEVPVPKVKHEVIRGVEPSKVFDELLAALSS